MKEILEKGYKNTGYLFIILFVIVIFGFFKTYFGLFPHFNEQTTLIVHFHAFVLVLWVVLLITQPLLIRYKKIRAHRLLGKFTYVLVPLIIFSFIGMMNKLVNEAHALKTPSPQILKALYLPFCDTILFSTFYILAIINRRNTSSHMRYIIATGFVFINPSLIRTLGIWFHIEFFYAALISMAFVDLMLIGFIYFDRVRNRRFRPFVIILTLFLVYHTGIIILYHL